jgi:hypothetical protein
MEVMTHAAHQQLSANYVAIGCGGLLLLLCISCIAMMGTSSQDSHTTYGEPSGYMTDREYRDAKGFVDHWNSEGASDAEIRGAVDAELRRRGE